MAVIRAKNFRKPTLLPPRTPPHLLTNLITVVDAEGGNAMPLVESGCPFHDLDLFGCLFKHLLNTWKLEHVISQPGKPLAPYLRRVQIRNTLNIPHKSHVGNQWMDSAPATYHFFSSFF